MTEPMPIVLVPGLLCSPRLYASQIPALWQFGPVTVADHRRDETVDAIARRILAAAPPRFALAGLSMGGYIAYAILRAAPERVTRLALLDTGSRADLPEQSRAPKSADRARTFRSLRGNSRNIVAALRSQGPARRRGAEEDHSADGAGHRRRRFHPPANGDHVTAGFAPRSAEDQMPDSGARGRGRSAHAAEIVGRNRGRRFRTAVSSSFPAAAISRHSSARMPSTRRWWNG